MMVEKFKAWAAVILAITFIVLLIAMALAYEFGKIIALWKYIFS